MNDNYDGILLIILLLIIIIMITTCFQLYLEMYLMQMNAIEDFLAYYNVNNHPMIDK